MAHVVLIRHCLSGEVARKKNVSKQSVFKNFRFPIRNSDVDYRISVLLGVRERYCADGVERPRVSVSRWTDGRSDGVEI